MDRVRGLATLDVNAFEPSRHSVTSTFKWGRVASSRVYASVVAWLVHAHSRIAD